MKRSRYPQPLGELEADIMDIVWRRQQVSVRDVLNQLKKKRPVAYTTVMTVMSRLADKGILRRQPDESGAYIYEPTQGRQAFFVATSRTLITRLIENYGAVAVAQFIDVVETSTLKDLQGWKLKLKKIK